jgi:hypothetical protein
VITVAAPKTLYRFTRPDDGRVVFVEKGGRQVRWATFGLYEGRGWLHLGYSAQEDFAKARSAGRGTNPYGTEYTAVPMTVVTAEERDAESAQKEEESSTRTLVAYVNMINPRVGIVEITGLSGRDFPDMPQARVGYDEGQRQWYADDLDHGIRYRNTLNLVVIAYIKRLSQVGLGFDPKAVDIRISREY